MNAAHTYDKETLEWTLLLKLLYNEAWYHFLLLTGKGNTADKAALEQE